MTRHRGEGIDRTRADRGRVHARDAALRRTRGVIAGVAAGAVALSGLFSVVAAQAFKGHGLPAAATPAPRSDDATPGARVGDATPPATDDPAPLQPPAQAPAGADPQSSAPAPEPQVSGGS